MTSDQYLSTLNKYKETNNRVISLQSYIENCEIIIEKCKPLVEETIIDGETIDKGLLTSIENSLNNLKNSITQVTATCNSEINNYSSLYQSALKQEEQTEKNN